MVASQNIIVKIMATILLFLRKNAEIICPAMAHMNESMMMLIELLGVLWKRSTPISSIFCPMAVEMARNAPMGTNNRIYFFVIPRMLGSECFIVCANDLSSKSSS